MQVQIVDSCDGHYSPAVKKRIVDRKESLNLSKSLFVALARRTNRTCGTDGADRSRTCDWFKLSFLKRSTLLKRNHMNRPITCTAFHSHFVEKGKPYNLWNSCPAAPTFRTGCTCCTNRADRGCTCKSLTFEMGIAVPQWRNAKR